MDDRTVSMGCVMAVVAWALTFALGLGGTIALAVADSHASYAVAAALILHALLGSAVAATLSIRRMFVRQNLLLRDAFDMGREIAQRRIGTIR